MTRSMILGLAAVLLVAGPAPLQAAPYEPLDPLEKHATGYSDMQLPNGHWRVTYLGDGKDSFRKVEADLLRRAAEITLAQGFSGFAKVDEEDSQPPVYKAPPAPVNKWDPNWRYFGEGFGWLDWEPDRQDPLWAEHETPHVIRRYEVSAEIQMYNGAPPAGLQNGQDAMKVLCADAAASSPPCPR